MAVKHTAMVFLFTKGVNSYKNYHRQLLLDNILKLLNKEYLTIMLSQKCRGFDFGKKQDGVFIEEKREEKYLNLYDLAREEAERFLYGMV
jgi:hypothetical protein